MSIRDPRDSDATTERTSSTPASPPAATPRQVEENSDADDLDLDLEELGDGDRLKEGFTGQER